MQTLEELKRDAVSDALDNVKLCACCGLWGSKEQVFDYYKGDEQGEYVAASPQIEVCEDCIDGFEPFETSDPSDTLTPEVWEKLLTHCAENTGTLYAESVTQLGATPAFSVDPQFAGYWALNGGLWEHDENKRELRFCAPLDNAAKYLQARASQIESEPPFCAFHPCTKLPDGSLEQCDETNTAIECWSVYGHEFGYGLHCVADCADKESAEWLESALDKLLMNDELPPFKRGNGPTPTLGDYPDTKRLGREFCKTLQAWIGQHLAEVNERNERYKAEGEGSICATHEFCDANMAMHWSWQRLTIYSPIQHGDEKVASIWNEAWSLAKSAGFDPARI
jgi:hypothetical protein